MIYKERYLSRIIIECVTPLVVGSGEESIMSDALVARDVNGLPYIPGTSLAGVLRHSLDKEAQELLMGYQDRDNGEGSRVVFSEAKLLDMNGIPIDGLLDTEDSKRIWSNLPIRQHVRIGHDGTAEKGGKYDQEVVPKGARFCFEIEMMGEGDMDIQEEFFLQMLNNLSVNSFRIGGGSRSGFGKVKVVEAYYRKLNLQVKEERDMYLEKSSCLSSSWNHWEAIELKPVQNNGTIYSLKLQPEDFFLFGSGYGNDNADMTAVRETMITWDKAGKANVVSSDQTLLIPASSVKGALSHRTAFHYNRRTGNYADECSSLEHTGKQNRAVYELFGSEGKIDSTGERIAATRGRVLFGDIVLKRPTAVVEKVLNHVKIDRFSGGAIAGALFSQEPFYNNREQDNNGTLTIDFEITLLEEDCAFSEHVVEAFEDALKDLCRGMLPLGGGVNRGNGCFIGSLLKNEKEI
ncbi:hypothetical protein IX339_000086 [Porphyromonas levii]|uniref:RAMP superfamily CRISPR-associated protein n=1 Tax=Porphyromonas levii TaxID=28114 RepID=UPI001B8D402A|nr:RAMP superfamily CRISPR-associated protein [Porphyromonas levii]MBR8730656.1 hypothetical protein [Porphyromonas levii]